MKMVDFEVGDYVELSWYASKDYCGTIIDNSICIQNSIPSKNPGLLVKRKDNSIFGISNIYFPLIRKHIKKKVKLI